MVVLSVRSLIIAALVLHAVCCCHSSRSAYLNARLIHIPDKINLSCTPPFAERGYYKTKVSLYTNHVATFNLSKLVLVGIHPNPGPGSNNYELSVNNLKTLYLNSRSLKAIVDGNDAARTKTSKLAIFQSLVYSADYDIVCVCETWLNECVLDNEILPGYVLHRRDRQTHKRGGGVLIAIKSNLQSIRRRNLEGPTAEHLMIELYPSNRTKFMLSVFYRPPNNDIASLLELQNSLNMLNDSCKLVLVGDFNLPNINWSREFPTPSANGGRKEELFCDLISDTFLFHTINGPTHIHGSKLDCVLGNAPHLISNTETTHPSGVFPTDHYLIEFDIILRFRKLKEISRAVYDFKNADLQGLRECLSRTPLDLAALNINICWQEWKDLFLTAVDEFVPTKFVREKTSPPWIDSEVKHLIRKKYTALRSFRKNRTPHRKKALRDLTIKIKDLIKCKHRDYLRKVQDSFANNPKIFWSYSNAVLHKKVLPSTVLHNGFTAKSSKEKADIFNSYFLSTFLPKSQANNFTSNNSTPKTNTQMPVISISVDEVLLCLKSLVLMVYLLFYLRSVQTKYHQVFVSY